jgi:hypothetical protein
LIYAATDNPFLLYYITTANLDLDSIDSSVEEKPEISEKIGIHPALFQISNTTAWVAGLDPMAPTISPFGTAMPTMTGRSTDAGYVTQ